MNVKSTRGTHEVHTLDYPHRLCWIYNARFVLQDVRDGWRNPSSLDIHRYIVFQVHGAITGGWQEVRITSAVPLDMLFIYCQRKLEILTDSAAVLSVCPSQVRRYFCQVWIVLWSSLWRLKYFQGNASDLLATVRCQAGTRRLWVRLRNSDREKSLVLKTKSKKLLIYALPAGAPRVARLITLKLPVLIYYSKHEDPDIDEDLDR